MLEKEELVLFIASDLIFKYHICANEAAQIVRNERKGAIENKDQLEYCKKFFQCIFFDFFFSELREVFTKNKKEVFTFIKH